MKAMLIEIKHCQLAYLKDINNLKKSENWKIKLILGINSMSSKKTDEDCLMHSNSDNREIMISDKADEGIK